MPEWRSVAVSSIVPTVAGWDGRSSERTSGREDRADMHRASRTPAQGTSARTRRPGSASYGCGEWPWRLSVVVAMALDAPLDLYALKRSFERINELIDLGAATADLRFLRTARRALLPMPLVDRPRPIDTDVFAILPRPARGGIARPARGRRRHGWWRRGPCHGRRRARVRGGQRAAVADRRLLGQRDLGLDVGRRAERPADGGVLPRLASAGLPGHPVAQAPALRAGGPARLQRHGEGRGDRAPVRRAAARDAASATRRSRSRRSSTTWTSGASSTSARARRPS